MMKKVVSLVAGLGLLLTLTACGNKLSTPKNTYRQSGLVAVIKGDVSGATQVKYKTSTESGSVKAHGGKFAISLPVTDRKQTVKLTAGARVHQVKVAAATPIGQYAAVASKFNQAIIGSALPKSDQAQMRAKQPTKAELAQMTPAEQAAYGKKAKAMQAAYAKADAATKAKQLATDVDSGIHAVLNSSDAVIRANVAHKKVIGFALIVPVKNMKNKTKAQEFGTTLALLGSAASADAKVVMKKFAKAIKDQNNSQTTMKTIKSNDVKFDVGFSATHLYIYVTK